MAKKSRKMIVVGNGVIFRKKRKKKKQSKPKPKRKRNSKSLRYKRACKLFRRGRRNMWKVCQRLAIRVNTQIVLTYDTSKGARPEMREKKGKISKKVWKKAMKDKRSVAEWLRRNFPEITGIWSAEICPDSRAIHFHWAVYVPSEVNLKLGKKIWKFWNKKTKSTAANNVSCDFNYKHKLLLSYLYKQSKVSDCYPLHTAKAGSRRKTWGTVNNPPLLRPKATSLSEKTDKRIRNALIDYYKKKNRKKKLKKSEKEHLKRLKNDEDIRHGFQGRELKIINEILIEEGYEPIKLEISE